jgi:hypothetical protein
MAGISDLVGNVNEWFDGLKIIDGRLYFPADNDFTLSDAQWPASPVYLDTTTASVGDRNGATDSGDVVLNDRILHYSETPTPAGGTDPGDFDSAVNAWVTSALSTTYDTLSLEKRQQLAQLVIAPKLASSDDPLFPEVKGTIYLRNYGERRPCWGGTYGYGNNSGLASMDLYPRRSTVNITIGFRPAFIL